MRGGHLHRTSRGLNAALSILYFANVKSAYGLEQAPLVWYTLLSTTLLHLGFVASLADPCLLHKTDPYGVVHHVLIFVDDLPFASPSKGLGFTSSLSTRSLLQRRRRRGSTNYRKR